MARRIRDRVLNPDDDLADWRRSLTDANIPEKYWGSTVEAVREPRVKLWLSQAVANSANWLSDGHGFFIHGPLNAGKSSCAAIFAMDALRRCERVLWLPVRDVPLVRFHEGERGKMLDEKLHRADLLVLDDLGSERFKLSSAAGPALEETIRIMYDRNRSIIVTSNMEWGEFSARSDYAVQAKPLVSVLRRRVLGVEVRNDQWPVTPESSS
jgi:DNA replication protein DnaC